MIILTQVNGGSGLEKHFMLDLTKQTKQTFNSKLFIRLSFWQCNGCNAAQKLDNVLIPINSLSPADALADLQSLVVELHSRTKLVCTKPVFVLIYDNALIVELQSEIEVKSDD